MITPASPQDVSDRSSWTIETSSDPTSLDKIALEYPAAVPGELRVGQPERALAAGVLRQAQADLRRFLDCKDAVGREVYSDAYSWFFSGDADWPYSFTNVCQVLGVSPEVVLDQTFVNLHGNWRARSCYALARVVTSLQHLLTSRRPRTLALANS